MYVSMWVSHFMEHASASVRTCMLVDGCGVCLVDVYAISPQVGSLSIDRMLASEASREALSMPNLRMNVGWKWARNTRYTRLADPHHLWCEMAAGSGFTPAAPPNEPQRFFAPKKNLATLGRHVISLNR